MSVSRHDSPDAEAGTPYEKEARTLISGDGLDDKEKKIDENSVCSSSNPPSNADTEEDLESPQDNLPPTSISESSSETGIRAREENQHKNVPETSVHNDSNNTQNTGCELSSVVILSVDKLPPLPKPRHDILRNETPRGPCVVMTCVVLCVFLTHYIALTLVLPSDDFENDDDDTFEEDNSNRPYVAGKIVFLVLVYTESVVALLCTTGILRADPCVIKRTAESCNPLPKAVESWALSAPSDPRPKGLDQYLKGADKRLYCTKCLVWRNPGVTHFHCAICQRCCAYHDHHCNVFGRCIAGNPRFWESNKSSNSSSSSGNLLYFYGILASGAWAFFTVFAAFLYAFSVRYRPVYAIPIGVLVMLVASCCCFGNGPIRIICTPIRHLMRCAIRWDRR